MCMPKILLIWVIRVYFLEGIFSRVGSQGVFGHVAILNLCGNSGISIKPIRKLSIKLFLNNITW